MDPVLTSLALIALLFVLIALGTYIGVALLVVGFLGITLLRGFDVALGQLTQVPFSGTAVFAYTIIPMFMIMGEAALRSGLTTRLFRSFNLWLGRLPGGLGAATVATSAMFAAISGSSVAMTLMMSRVAIPEMRAAGYRDGYSGSVLASAGSIAVLIPPSAMLVVYALLTEQSIGRALIAGLVPGLLTVLLYLVVVVGLAAWRPEIAPRAERATWGERVGSLRDLLPVGGIALIVVGGIYTGFLTPTESAAAGAFAVIVLGILRRSLGGRAIMKASGSATVATVQIFLILIGALMFGRFVALAGLGNAIVSWIEAAGLPVLAVILLIVVIYLVLGTFLEGMSALVITVPLLAPVVEGLGLDLLWFGVIVVKLIEISVITPPLGFNVLVLNSSVPDLDIGEVWRRVWVFVVLDLVIIALLIVFPQLVLWLPAQMG